MAEKGWDRASLDFNVRPDKVVRDISRADLRAPSAQRKGGTLLLCLACGVMISILFVWTTLAMFATMGLISARWVYAIVLAVAVVTGLLLYVFATWDFKRWREWAGDA
jgi:hypothetical protein